MPSQAHTGFRQSEWNFVRGYRNELVNMMNAPQSERNLALEDWLQTIGYKTSVDTFVNEQGEVKTTLYAIYHVPKGDDTEAMVLVAPWFTEERELNINGVAITMGLGKYLHRLSIWAKNVILVFPDTPHEDLRHWVDAYHTKLDHTGGSLEAAIILEHASTKDHMSHIEVDYAGVNGQLPNLDLVNTAILVAHHEGFKVSVNHTPHAQLWSEDVYTRMGSLFSGIVDLAAAGSAKWTAAQSFSGWNVQTITIRGVGEEGPDVTVLGRVVESTFRAVNNLLEKFHQSFFFYLMLSPRFFVSIASYLPAGCLAAVGYVLASLNAFVGGIFIKRVQGDSMLNKYALGTGSLAWAFGTLVLAIASSLFYAIYLMKAYSALDTMDTWTTLTYITFVGPLLGASVLPLVSMVVPFGKMAGAGYARGLATTALFYFGYVLVAQLVLNFALPYLVALSALGLCYIRCPSSINKMVWTRTKFANTLLLIFSSPATSLILFGTLNAAGFQLDRMRNFVQYPSYKLLQREIQAVLDYVEETPLEVWIAGPVDLFRALVLSYSRVQCWTWLFVAISWVPVWLCMCVVASLDGAPEEVDIAKKDK